MPIICESQKNLTHLFDKVSNTNKPHQLDLPLMNGGLKIAINFSVRKDNCCSQQKSLGMTFFTIIS